MRRVRAASFALLVTLATSGVRAEGVTPAASGARAESVTPATSGVRAEGVTPAANGARPEGEPSASEVIVPKRVVTERWFYGWPILAVGETGALLTSASLVLPDHLLGTSASTVGFIAGVPAFVLAGPIVHWSHDDFAKGVISLSANLALPVISGFVGRSIACSGDADEGCAYHGFGAGFAVAALLLPIADALLLGWEDVPVDETAQARPSRQLGATIVPRFVLSRTGALELGVGGTF
jgi:hypothetical protein